MSQKELWEKIKGYEDYYEASSFGGIRSCDKFVFRRNKFGKIHSFFRAGRVITPKRRGKYLAVRLHKYMDSKMYSVHRLVAIAFVCGSGNQINHKDEDKYNNKAENLEWCNGSYNQIYSKGRDLTAIRDGRIICEKGVPSLAREIGISQASIWRLLSGGYKTCKGWEVFYTRPY